MAKANNMQKEKVPVAYSYRREDKWFVECPFCKEELEVEPTVLELSCAGDRFDVHPDLPFEKSLV